jgi:hypothetical protein
LLVFVIDFITWAGEKTKQNGISENIIFHSNAGPKPPKLERAILSLTQTLTFGGFGPN